MFSSRLTNKFQGVLSDIEYLGAPFYEKWWILDHQVFDAFWIFQPLKTLPTRWLGFKLPKFTNIYDIRLLGRFAPMFYFICKHGGSPC